MTHLMDRPAHNAFVENSSLLMHCGNSSAEQTNLINNASAKSLLLMHCGYPIPFFAMRSGMMHFVEIRQLLWSDSYDTSIKTTFCPRTLVG